LCEKESMPLVVKFGGSSLADSAKIAKAASAVSKTAKKGKVVVVVSAMGRTTDSLLETVNEATESRIEARDLDDILATGERTSARIFASALKAMGVDAMYLDPEEEDWPIITDASFGDASPILPFCEELVKERLGPLLERGKTVVVPGFIGKTREGDITTLGRGGSDTTAFILARGLMAREVVLVTDVDGILTADPKVIGEPRLLEEVSIEVLSGLADSGTKFIHKKALKYKHPDIDVRVINSAYGDLKAKGTLIKGSLGDNPTVENISEMPVTSVTLVGRALSESPELLQVILDELKKEGTEILGLTVNRDSVILYIQKEGIRELLERLHSIVIEEEKLTAMAVGKDLALIKIKGLGLEETPGVIRRVTEALYGEGMNIYGLFTITSSIQILVEWNEKEAALQLIKEAMSKK